ncbi:glycerol-3-phosphate dehydrogenase/oxidase [Glaciecola sp. MH2013]|uniref:glycerol-3-phosphate dehydrogenase/oxidase n=1 Tax=Glaciecola sp. MH2013 TaxID=2785524 RepID=UPI00189DEB6A|nr:glycerol-3-phosphate dehydrogenase/oxidase [Glaciecola sp. MH2013]MBF7073167.1 glycerol-3-phosphate dehydrogenase/oxidase [Glaciecola sp. MH2013]
MLLRETNINKLSEEVFDVLVLGAGINGAVSAASLSRKGASVAMIDKGDFAGQTSSNSSNLAWGGIKYLENHEYLLVNKLCKSRNHLMRSYPSTVQEIRFLTTLQKGFRFPAWFVFMGTCLYWLMGRFFTQSPRFLSSQKIKALEPAIDISNAQGGFEYSDAFLHDNDARFVFNFVRSAMDNGAIVTNYVGANASKRVDGLWHTEATDQETGKTFTIRSTSIINACGPMVDPYNELVEQKTEHKHLFSKGVHLIVNKLTKVDKVLAFFASDGRLFFVIPMGQKTCLGTTDNQVTDPNTSVTEEDRDFILDNVNALLDLDNKLTRADIISERCGVRPLAVKDGKGDADWVQLSRKHAIDVNHAENYLSVFGGKLTDCINVGEEIADIVAELGIELPHKDAIWYGESASSIKKEFEYRAALIGLDDMTPSYSSEKLTTRLWRRYDIHALQILDEIQRDPTQAEQLMKNAEYLRAEVHYAARREMITHLEDFVRRRSKIEMVLRKTEIVNTPGMIEACEILFGDKAEEKRQEYVNKVLADHPGTPVASVK